MAHSKQFLEISVHFAILWTVFYSPSSYHLLRNTVSQFLSMFNRPLWLSCQPTQRILSLHGAFQYSDPITICQQIHQQNKGTDTLMRFISWSCTIEMFARIKTAINFLNYQNALSITGMMLVIFCLGYCLYEFILWSI